MPGLFGRCGRGAVLLVALAGGAAAAAWGTTTWFAPTASAPTDCTIYWTGATSTDWGTATNWSLTDGGTSAGRTPTTTDVVCMSGAPTTAVVVLGSSTTAVVEGIKWPLSGSVAPNLTVRGSLTLGDSSLVVASRLDQFTDPGTTVLSTGETLSTLSASLTGTLEGPGAMTVTGPTVLGNGSDLGVSDTTTTAVKVILQGATTVNGTVDMNGGSILENEAALTLSSGADLVNDATGSNELLNDAKGTITFAGTSSSASASAQVLVADKGAVSVTEGTLSIGGGFTPVTDTGSFTVASGATLALGGTRTESSGANIGGAGTLEVAGVDTFGPGSHLAPTGSFEVGGTLALNASMTVPNLTLDGSLEGPDILTVTGPTTLDGYSSLGGYDAQSTAPPPAHLITQGATTANGSVYLNGGSVLENQGAITLADHADVTTDDTDDNQLVNDAKGTVTFAGATKSASASVEVEVVDKGAVTVTGGTLHLGGGVGGSGNTAVTDSGVFTVATGATLDLGGTRTESTSAKINGAGTVEITGDLTVSAATNLAGSGPFEVIGQLVTSVAVTVPDLTLDGNLEGPGALTVTGPTVLGDDSVLGAPFTSSASVQLITEGTTKVNGNVYLDGGSVLENQGTLGLTNGSGLFADDTSADQLLNDAGATVTTTGTSPAAAAAADLLVTNNGTVAVTAGSLAIGDGTTAATDTGTFTAAAGATLDLGGTRTEASGATVGGAGTVDVTGTVTFAAAGATLSNTGNFEVDGTVVLNGPVTAANLTLDGTLEGPDAFTVTGPTVLDDAGDLGVSGQGSTAVRLVTQGPTTVNGTVSLDGGSTLENQGPLVLDSAAVLADGDGDGNALANDSHGTITFTPSQSGMKATIGLSLTNDGAVVVDQGTLVIDSLTDLASGQLSGGTYSAVGGTLSLPAPFTTNAATVVVGSAGIIASGGTNVLPGLTANSGSLTLDRSETLKAALSNSGTVVVSAGTLGTKGYAQSAGSTTVLSGATLATGSKGGGAVTISGGTLTGNGTVTGVVNGAGTLTPGQASGPLTITGGYTAPSGGTLQIDISGPSAPGTDFGQLSVSGVASVKDGTLAIVTAGGYTPPVGTTYTVVTAGSVKGSFSSVTGATVGSEMYVVSTTATSVVLTVEPAGTAPEITSAATTSFTAGSAGTFTVTTTGSPTPALSSTGTLPAGVTFSDDGDGTATLAGTPAAGSAGSYPLTVTATNSVSPDATQDFTLTVNGPPGPAVTGITPTNVGEGASSYAAVISGSGFDTSVPPTLSSGSGVIYGSIKVVNDTTIDTRVSVNTSAATGARDVKVTQSGASGVCTGCLTINAAPTLSDVNPATLARGTTTTVTVSGTGFVAGAKVAFTGPGTAVTAQVTAISSTTLTLTVTVPVQAATGSYTLKLTNGDGGPATLANALTVT